MQPQYAYQTAPMNTPLMASGGLASLPIRRFQSGGSTGPYKYSYDPKTQRYTLLNSGQQADQMLAAQKKLPPYSPSADGGPGSVPDNAPPGNLGSPATMGSSGGIGGLAQSVGGAIAGVKDTLGVLSYAVPGLMTAEMITNAIQDRAIEQNAIVDAQLKAANEQANQARVSTPYFSTSPRVTTAVDISPVPDPAVQQVSPIAPDVVTPGLPVTDLDVNVDPTVALTAMNQMQAEEDVSTPDISDVAATVAATQDAADTSASDAAAAAAAASAATGGTGTGNDAGVGGGGGGADTSASDAAAAAAAASAATGGTGTGNDAGVGDGGGGGGGCFLTTAAVRYMGQKDNGEVLNTLRNFRDTYMQKDREKNKDVQWYYTNAPRIMRALDARKDAGSVYREMYNNYVIPAYRNIKAGKNAEAYADYKKLVNFAKRESGIENEDLTPKPKHYMYGGQVMNYEQGGLAAARQAQSKGRGQDTMLVHMTPREVGGLQALAMSQGGSLTINPQTGLPEAGFLSSILPMIAGFALGPAGFGVMSSLNAGLAVGALTGIATGSLKKGLMAGLGAYGGAGLGQGLVNAATPLEGAVLPTGAEAGLTSAADMAASNLPPELLNSPITTSTSGIDPGLLEGRGLTPNSPYFRMAQSNIDPGLLEGMGGTPGMTAQQVATAPVINPTPSIPISPTTGFARAGEGFTNMFQTGAPGEAARSAFMKGAPTGSLMAAGTSLASGLTPEPAPLPTSKSFIRGYDLDITNPSGTPQYTPQDTREREQVRYVYRPRGIYEAAQGGLAALNGQTYDDEYGRDEYKAGGQTKVKSRSLKGEPYYKFADSRRDTSMEAAIEQNFAKGGLGTALPPRFLSGGGDGMSDSIKANIDGKQEARLADGEFVVPADVVSHLGNGSSKAGAKKLYAMMDKIRKARTGSKRQAPEVNARRYMPA